MPVRSAFAGLERAPSSTAPPAVQIARRLFALLIVAAVALASVFSGRSYLWCIPMQQVELVCEDDDEEETDGPALHEDCCEEFAVGELPRAERREAHPSVLGASVTILPSASPPVITSRLPAAHFASAARTLRRYAPARAGPPSAAERCVTLQVFRC